MNKFFLSKNKNAIAFILLLIICILIIFLGRNNPINLTISSYIKTVTIPFLSFFNLVSNTTTSIFNSLTEINTLKKSLETVQEKVRKYEMQSLEVDKYKIQINELKRSLGYKIIEEENNPFELISCEIVSWGIKSYFKSLIINKGVLDGIEKDMPVIAFQNGQKGVVGKVIEAGVSYSKVLPLHNMDFEIGALLEKEKYIGIVNGRGKINEMELNYIDKKTHLSIGDKIITLGENSIFPKGIIIGYIGKVLPINYEFYQRAYIKPYIEIAKLHDVFVIKKLPDIEINELKNN